MLFCLSFFCAGMIGMLFCLSFFCAGMIGIIVCCSATCLVPCRVYSIVLAKFRILFDEEGDEMPVLLLLLGFLFCVWWWWL